MTKLEKIDLQEQQAREKIAAMQAVLKQIDGQRTEQENLQIVQQVRALKLSRDELYAFLSGGAIPANLAEAMDKPAGRETIYSRRGKNQNDTPEIGENNFESEDIKDEK